MKVKESEEEVEKCRALHPTGPKTRSTTTCLFLLRLFGQIHLHPSPLTSRLGVPIFDSLASSALPNILFLPPPYCRLTLITTW